MPSIHPYLSFAGNCGEAMEFYRSVFGGEFSMIHRFSDMDSGMPIPDDEKSWIMHVSLPIGNGFVLMASDSPTGMGELKPGNNYSVSINADSEDEATRLFNGLAAGGNIIMPLQKTFWGAFFGMWIDKFGIHWMVNYDYEQKP